MSISIEALWIAVALVAWGALAAFRLTVFTRTRFHIAVLYKSGNRVDQWFTKFNIDGGTYSWKSYVSDVRPISMDVDNVEAVWQLDQRTNVFHWIWVNTKAVMQALGGAK